MCLCFMPETRLARMKFIFEDGVKDCVRAGWPKIACKEALLTTNFRGYPQKEGTFSVFLVIRGPLWFCTGPIDPAEAIAQFYLATTR
jgi:hypothetical protein